MGLMVEIGGKVAELYEVHARVENRRQALAVGGRQARDDPLSHRDGADEGRGGAPEAGGDDLLDAERERRAKREAAERAAGIAKAKDEATLLGHRNAIVGLRRDQEDDEDLRPIRQANRIAEGRLKLQETGREIDTVKRDRRAINRELADAGLEPSFDPRQTPTEQMRRATATSASKRNNQQYAEGRMLQILASVGYDPRKLSPEQLEEFEDLQQALYEANDQVNRDALDDVLRGKPNGHR